MPSWLVQRLERNRARCLELRNRWYPQHEWPGAVYLAELRARPGGALLEIGCGWRADMLRRVTDCFERCVGVDPDCAGRAVDDPRIELYAADAVPLPFAAESFDVVAMLDTAEHLPDPAAAFRECARVLKPGGRLIVQTVNQSYWLIAAARALPHAVRAKLNRYFSGTAEFDTFPTHYRANSRAALQRLAAAAGLRLRSTRYLTHHPTYFLFSPAVYRLAARLERILTRRNICPELRPRLHVVFTKPAASPA